ncbi:PAB-dependent poly(A)-specific ribonuclease subunit pan3 [Aureobasidium sp. EXF-3400]|nr:PAB-dependent poly(A)-specific ribonuclease subunit pan3 [Aureobasidium sp. EXF-12344]KAI4774330.1 PAB-dependent poly(A)-specific ribonuclease subunit pan3 [Aureobasidium sp. EXF-3400]
MAASGASSPGDMRRRHQSPRPKGRENTKNVLCRNVTIYGSCRAQNNGCPYNHELPPKPSQQAESAKRFLNVDSPSFKPLSPVTNNVQPVKALGISPKAASAAVFTPKSTVPVATAKQPSAEWSQRGIQEFVPQNFVPQAAESASSANNLSSFDPFTMQGNSGQMSDASHAPQINPYAQDASTLAASSMFSAAAAYAHPLSYHLYAPLGPHRENLMAYQRTTHDFFIPDHLREEMQRKSEASLQTFSNTALPQQIEHFHSLVALDTNAQKSASAYGYPSWIYKATSSKDGYNYALRRLEGFRLTDENAIRAIQTWKRISNGNVVTVHDAFTTRAFGDSSLIVVTDYHPLSQTLADKIFTPNARNPGVTLARSPGNYVTDHELWGYIVQLASAIKAIHSIGLAARLMIPQKILITSKSRLRLNSCGILDITQYEQGRSISELQQDDILQMGRLILCIANKNPTAHHNTQKSLEHVGRAYSEKMREVVTWLLTPATPMTPTQASTSSPDSAAATTSPDHDIDSFLSLISSQIVLTFDASLHEADSLTSNLSRELENARLVRLLTKLDMILERPETTLTSSAANPNQPAAPHTLNHTSSAWSETGERYYLKLFRDYVFHQVDADGRPILDLGHILTCLNKLDAGIEEKIMLVSRDEQNCFVVSYREVKRGFESAWTELMKTSQGGRR